MTPPTDREAPENLQLRKAQGTRHGYRGPAEASAAGSVTCRHSGSCKENRRKRADGLRIKSHTGKIHADMGACGSARQRPEAGQSLPGRQSGPAHHSVGSFSQLGGSKSVKVGQPVKRRSKVSGVVAVLASGQPAKRRRPKI